MVGSLILKLVRIKLSKRSNMIICTILPLLTLAVFASLLIECHIRREKEIKILDELISIVENSLSYNHVFTSNEEKKECEDSLLFFNEQLNNILSQDSLTTFICGESEDIKKRVNFAKGVVESQLKRVNRLNDYLDVSLKIDSIQRVDNIHLQEPVPQELPTLNLIFSCSNVLDSTVAIQVLVMRDDTIAYSRQYEYNLINSITVPHDFNSKESLKLGYITKKDNKHKFNYIVYGK